MSNISSQYREILPVGFEKLLNCSLKQSSLKAKFSPLPPISCHRELRQHPCAFLSQINVSHLSMELSCSLPLSENLLFTCFILLLKISWSVGKFRKTCEEQKFHFQAVVSTFENSVIMNRCN